MFIAFNATAHSLIATNLSRRADDRAASVLARIAQLAVAMSLPLAALLFLGRAALPGMFTDDLAVQREVADVLPLLLAIMVSEGPRRRCCVCWVSLRAESRAVLCS